MTTVDDIMAEALKNARDERNVARVGCWADKDRALSPRARAAKAIEPAGIKLAPEQQRARRARSIAIAVSLGLLVILFYIVTLVKGPGVLVRPL